MKTNNLLVATVVGLLFTSFSFGQTTPQILPENPTPKVEAKQSEKMSTLFSGVKNPLKKLHHLGLSVGSEIIYGGNVGKKMKKFGCLCLLLASKEHAY